MAGGNQALGNAGERKSFSSANSIMEARSRHALSFPISHSAIFRKLNGGSYGVSFGARANVERCRTLVAG